MKDIKKVFLLAYRNAVRNSTAGNKLLFNFYHGECFGILKAAPEKFTEDFIKKHLGKLSEIEDWLGK